MAHSVLAKLKLFVAKMNLGIVNPAFTSAPKATLEERLGIDPVEKRLLAYEKWKLDPYLCSQHEFALAQTYRYENDLMTPDEEREYESRT